MWLYSNLFFKFHVILKSISSIECNDTWYTLGDVVLSQTKVDKCQTNMVTFLVGNPKWCKLHQFRALVTTQTQRVSEILGQILCDCCYDRLLQTSRQSTLVNMTLYALTTQQQQTYVRVMAKAEDG